MISSPVMIRLSRLVDEMMDIFIDEVNRSHSLKKKNLDIGDIHPGFTREGHIQCLLFSGLRDRGYESMAEENYFHSTDSSRQLDLAVWIHDIAKWLLLEVKPCSPLFGYQLPLEDAFKLRNDRVTDPRDRLRGVFAYGFRDPVDRDGFPEKYARLSHEMKALDFQEIGIRYRPLEGTDFVAVQIGLWVTDVIEPLTCVTGE